jgi:solute carrier family 25 citrate transporter 1
VYLGALAGAVTVYTTMPLDVVKTRLQLIGAKGNIISNLVQVVKDDGVLALWKGATPRLGRLIFSGGIVFTIFESVVSIYNSF